MLKIIQYVLTVNIYMLLNGFANTWSSPYLPALNIQGTETVLFIALGPIGAVIAMIFQVTQINRIGRKRILLYASPFYIIGWSVMGFSTDLVWLCAGRFLIGFGEGLTYPSIPIYLCEIAPTKIRGMVMSSKAFSQALGATLLYIQADYLSIRMQCTLSAILSVICGVLIFFIPETPYYLLLRGDYMSGEKVLKSIRNTTDTDKEMKEIVDLTEIDLSSNVRFLDFFLEPSSRKALIIISSMTFILSFSEANIITTLGASIFDSTSSNVDGRNWTVIMGSFTVLGVLCSSIIMDFLGRRKVFLLTSGGSTICCLLVGVYFSVKNSGGSVGSFYSAANAIIILTQVLHTAGLSTIGSVMIGELFLTSHKAKAFVLCAVINNLCLILSVDVFEELWTNIGLDVCFYMFMVSNALSCIYIVFCIPETAQKTLGEIHNSLLKK